MNRDELVSKLKTNKNLSTTKYTLPSITIAKIEKIVMLSDEFNNNAEVVSYAQSIANSAKVGLAEVIEFLFIEIISNSLISNKSTNTNINTTIKRADKNNK